MSARPLHEYLLDSARGASHRVAIVEPSCGSAVTAGRSGEIGATLEEIVALP
jgi:hypothetical protein